MGKERVDRNTFFDKLVRESIIAISKGPISLDRVYIGNKILIKNQIKITPEREQEYNKLLEILQRSYTMFSDSEVQKIILENNISAKQFISKYGEKLLGDNKRKYNMADRFEPDLIASYQGKETDGRKIKYIPKKGIEHIYLDEEGKGVSIQEIGRLYFEEWSGLKSSVSRYRVMKQLAEGEYQTSEIFSNIRITEMENPEYREAVLGELLSKNNIELSKAGGYVGEITDIPTLERVEIGSEKIIAGDYFYRVNPKYMITYHSEEIAAAMLLEQEQRSKSKGKIEQNSEYHDEQDKGGRKLGGDSR